MSKTYEQWLEEQRKSGQAMLENQRKAINTNYDTQIENTQSEYNSLMKDTSASYEDYYKKNELQKIINEKQLAERMANTGLTDSGFSRSQMTGLRLSYANQNYKLDLQKQKALDEQSAALAKAVSELKSARDSELYTANSNWESQMQSNAATLYNKQVDSETELAKAAISASSNSSSSTSKSSSSTEKYDWWQNTGTSVDDEIVKFYNATTGKTVEFKKGINPYTGKKISGYTKAELAQGVWNGYQPKLIKYDGQALKKVSGSDVVAQLNYQGHNKNVWDVGKTVTVEANGTTYNTSLFIWSDNGYYVPVINDNNGNIFFAED